MGVVVRQRTPAQIGCRQDRLIHILFLEEIISEELQQHTQTARPWPEYLMTDISYQILLPPALGFVTASVLVEGVGTVGGPDIPGEVPDLGRTGPGGWIVRSYEGRQVWGGSTGGERMFHRWKVFR